MTAQARSVPQTSGSLRSVDGAGPVRPWAPEEEVRGLLEDPDDRLEPPDPEEPELLPPEEPDLPEYDWPPPGRASAGGACSRASVPATRPTARAARRVSSNRVMAAHDRTVPRVGARWVPMEMGATTR